MTNHTELRQKALGANRYSRMYDTPWFSKSALLEESPPPTFEIADAEYIADADPQTILELLDEIEGLDVQPVLDEIREWAQATFGGQDVSGKIAHLHRELIELEETPLDIDEYADCFTLLMDAAGLMGFTFKDVWQATVDKFEVNKKRKWGKPNADGSVEHIKEQPND